MSKNILKALPELDSVEAAQWNRDEIVYLALQEDKEGFVKIKSLHKKKPQTSAYLKTKIDWINKYNNGVSNDTVKIFLDYSFDRFYMEESKAPEAERLVNIARVDSTQVTYALISIKEGEAVIKNVMIGKKSLREAAHESLNTATSPP